VLRGERVSGEPLLATQEQLVAKRLDAVGLCAALLLGLVAHLV
jgi:hypothetical protein